MTTDPDSDDHRAALEWVTRTLQANQRRPRPHDARHTGRYAYIQGLTLAEALTVWDATHPNRTHPDTAWQRLQYVTAYTHAQGQPRHD